jgi:cAMP phosphodiesterase
VKIRVLGCHGSEQWVTGGRHHHCCGFLINDTVLLDAGTISSALTLAEQLNVREILLTHVHFDHIQGLPPFADNISQDIKEPVVITGTAETIADLRAHVFNNALYPDFFQMPQGRSVFAPRIVEPRHAVQVGGLTITAVLVNHLVPTVGFLIREGDRSIVYSGDTSSTEELWRIASRDTTLKAAFIETSYPNEMASLASASKHLTPALLSEEVGKLQRPDLPIYIYHMKPSHASTIERQLHDLHLPHLQVLTEGQEIIV